MSKEFKKFLSEAIRSDTPIEYQFTSIWFILQAQYIGTEHMAKAYDLGYNNYGCNYEPKPILEHCKSLNKSF